MNRLYVRTHAFKDDNYSSYWSGSEHAWGNLRTATVFTEKEIKTFRSVPRSDHSTPSGFVQLDSGRPYYVPVEGEWTPLPEILTKEPAA